MQGWFCIGRNLVGFGGICFVVRCCLAHGFRVQKSVFETFMEQDQLCEFEERMLRLIDENRDSVRIYPLDKMADAHIRIVGNGKRIDEQKYMII